jgi:hypothetical protein
MATDDTTKQNSINSFDTLEKKTKSSNWGGARPGSGRKPLMGREEVEAVKKLLAQHGMEIDEKTGKERLLVMMEKLYEMGITGNVQAVKEYCDRMLGKSKESVDVNLIERKILLD